MINRPECIALLRYYQGELYNSLDSRRVGVGHDNPRTEEIDRCLAGIAKYNEALKTFDVGEDNGAN